MVSPSGLAPEWPQRVELQLEICARRVRDTLRVLIYGAEKMGSVSPRRASRRPQTYLETFVVIFSQRAPPLKLVPVPVPIPPESFYRYRSRSSSPCRGVSDVAKNGQERRRACGAKDRPRRAAFCPSASFLHMSRIVDITPAWAKPPEKISDAMPQQPMRRLFGPHEKDLQAHEAAVGGRNCAAMWKTSAVNSMRLTHVLFAADVDGDGTIDREEFRALVAKHGGFRGSEEMFDKLDTDGDGTLDKKELQTMFSYGSTGFRSLSSGR